MEAQYPPGWQLKGRGHEHRDVGSKGPRDSRWNGYSLVSSTFRIEAWGRWKRNPFWLGNLRWYKGNIGSFQSVHFDGSRNEGIGSSAELPSTGTWRAAG